jgi:hypothetical protein
MNIDDLRAVLAEYPSNLEVCIDSGDDYEPITGVVLIAADGPNPDGIKTVVLTSLVEEPPTEVA